MIDTEEPERIPANENPWYCLATLYGEQVERDSWPLSDEDLAKQNRVAWNRWMAAALSDERRVGLIKKGFDASELIPLSEEERTEFVKAYAARTNLPAPDLKNTIDFDNVHFERPVSYMNFVFPCRASFDGIAFSKVANFTEAAFFGHANFSAAAFYDAASFRRVSFSEGGSFERAVFQSTAHFISASFCGPAGFEETQFLNEAHFRSATFSDYTSFNGAVFSARTTFVQAVFLGAANFSWATFSDNVFFSEAKLSSMASFNSAKFSGPANFEMIEFADRADFSECKFGRHTSFAGARFVLCVPDFRDAELREATEWHDAEWPHAPTDRKDARQHVYAYERLKAEMERLKKHEDEQLFFAKELRARRAIEKPFLPRWLLNWAYENFSGYGQSVTLPAFWLLIVFALGSDTFALAPAYKGAPLPYDLAEGLSATNLLSLLPYKPGKDIADHLSASAKVVGDIQSVLGLVLLFLLGLGLRNRFRMK
jgi:uncharacterized protein YjbI with pentapeptide repeats